MGGTVVRTAVFGLLLAGMAAGPAAGQSATLSLGRSTSDLREYASPVVVGGSVALPLVGWFGARLDLRHHADRQTWVRSVCTGQLPPTNDLCGDDFFTSSFSVTTVGLGPRVAVPLGSRWGLEAALLWSRAAFDGVWTGRDTGSTLGRAPREAQWGLSTVVGATFLWSAHWGATLQARRDNPQVTTCIEDTYYPYCDGAALRAVEVGVTFRR